MSTRSKLAGISLIVATAFIGCKETPKSGYDPSYNPAYNITDFIASRKIDNEETPKPSYNIDNNQVTLNSYDCGQSREDKQGDTLTIIRSDGITNKIISCDKIVINVKITGVNPEVNTYNLPEDMKGSIFAEAQKKRDYYIKKITESAIQKLQ